MIEFCELLKSRLSKVYFIMVFVVVTLYIRNAYFDVLNAKSRILLWALLFYVGAVFGIDIILICLDRTRLNSFFAGLDHIDYSLIGFILCNIISVVFSQTPQNAFWGTEGYKVGALHVCLLCVAVVIIVRNLVFDRMMILIMAISGMIVYILAIADCFGMDIMGWHEGVIVPYAFISTMGNINWYVGYMGLMIPFFVVWFLYETSLTYRIIYALFLFLGFINLYVSKCDGSILVFGGVIPLVLYILHTHVDLKCIACLFGIFILASACVRLMCNYTDMYYIVGDTIMGEVLLDYTYVYIIPVLALIVIWFFKDKWTTINWGNVWVGISVVIVLGIFVLTVFEFDMNYGSGRGYIWSYAWDIYRQSSLIQKIFGWGPNCFRNAIYSNVEERIYMTWGTGSIVVNAHNEILQYLVTMGIVGLVSYVYIFIAAFFSKTDGNSVLIMSARVALFSYFCTELVNNPQALNYGIMFMMIAFIKMKSNIKPQYCN